MSREWIGYDPEIHNDQENPVPCRFVALVIHDGSYVMRAAGMFRRQSGPDSSGTKTVCLVLTSQHSDSINPPRALRLACAAVDARPSIIDTVPDGPAAEIRQQLKIWYSNTDTRSMLRLGSALSGKGCLTRPSQRCERVDGWRKPAYRKFWPFAGFDL
jgi:hypothetical protein